MIKQALVPASDSDAPCDSQNGVHRNPFVSVVLLSYNRPAYLREALESASNQSLTPSEIIVIDNPSPSSPEIARTVAQFPSVRLIRNESNVGYTGGMNAGIREAAGEYVFLTEDDVVLERDCLKELVDFIVPRPSTGLCAPVIYNRTARTIRCAGGEVEIGAIYRVRIHGANEPDTGQFAQPFEVTYLAGAAMFAETHFLRTLGGFRPEYFMYGEDTELCTRVRATGRALSVVPQARVFHFEPGEQPTPPEIAFHKLKNFFSLYVLHAPLRVLPEFYLRYGVINFLRALKSDRASVWPMMRAWAWFLVNAPAFLVERYRKVSL
ncbi:MAG TPA: glycosyltransferase family 2 protein [Pyrinomonadaceae bacterium]|nr:glycosyltransferase family 2 protein [Pyrinomonadaceae bacterium]